MFLASGLEIGSSTALLNALIFWQLPFGIFSASIATVYFPAMSKQAAEKDISTITQTVNRGIGSLFALLIPSAVFLIFLGKPAIAVALQRGAYTAQNTEMASQVLITYALGLFSVAAFNFLQRLFYALGQYRTPLYIGTATMLLDVCLSLILRETALRVRGLALANSIAFTFGLVIMIITIGKKHNIKLYSSLLREATKVVFSSILVGLLCYAGFELFLYATWEYGSTIYNWLVTIGIGLVSVLILLSMYWLLHVQAFKQLIPGVLRRKLYETH
jgi:putative peptidoglycan lipid II flippase